MTLTYEQALDVRIKVIRDEWLSNALTMTYPIQFEDVGDDPPDAVGADGRPVPWLYVYDRVNAAPQRGPACSSYAVEGVMTAELRTPYGDGRRLQNQLAPVVMKIVRCSPISEPTFFDAVPFVIGQDGNWFRTDISWGFRYTEVDP